MNDFKNFVNNWLNCHSEANIRKNTKEMVFDMVDVCCDISDDFTDSKVAAIILYKIFRDWEDNLL